MGVSQTSVLMLILNIAYIKNTLKASSRVVTATLSEYKSEIERLKSHDGFLKCVISHSKDMMDEAVKEAQIDVLTELKKKYGFYICCSWCRATKLLGEIIDEFIEEIKNEQDTSNDTARG